MTRRISQLSKTVGTYSEGNLLVVYEIKRHVLDVSRAAPCQGSDDSLSDSSVTNNYTFDCLHNVRSDLRSVPVARMKRWGVEE